MMKNSILIVALCAGLIACGGDSTQSTDLPSTDLPSTDLPSTDLPSTDPINTQTGVFLGSIIANIGYKTETLQGVTNALGEYDYIEGETVTFFIGDLKLPTITAAEIVTPLDLADSDDTSNSTVVNIIRLLQTLDEDGNPDNGITITETAKSSATQVNFSLSITDFESSVAVTNLVANSGSSNVVLISQNTAVANFEDILRNEGLLDDFSFDAATLAGVYKVVGTNNDDFAGAHQYIFNEDSTVDIVYTDGTADTESWLVNSEGQLVFSGSISDVFTLTSGSQLSGNMAIVIDDADEIGAFNTAGTIEYISALDWTKKIQLYGHGFSVPTDFTSTEFEYIANTFKIFTVEKRHAYNSYGGNPSTERATIGTAATLKAINPDIEVLLYWNAVMNYGALYESNAEFNANPSWIHSIWPTGYDIYDLENIACQDWWVNSIVKIIEDGDLDGVFLDAGPKVGASGLIDAWNTAIDRVRARIGSDKTVIYNGYRVASPTNIQAGQEVSDHTSGVFIEFFLHAPLDTTEEAALLFDNLIDAYNDGKQIFPRGTPSSYLPETPLEDRFNFSFASFLLFYGPNSYWVYNEGYNKTQGMFDYYPQYYDIATGESLGNPQRDGWVYTREFENISIRVDLENRTATIKDKDGNLIH